LSSYSNLGPTCPTHSVALSYTGNVVAHSLDDGEVCVTNLTHPEKYVTDKLRNVKRCFFVMKTCVETKKGQFDEDRESEGYGFVFKLRAKSGNRNQKEILNSIKESIVNGDLVACVTVQFNPNLSHNNCLLMGYQNGFIRISKVDSSSARLKL